MRGETVSGEHPGVFPAGQRPGADGWSVQPLRVLVIGLVLACAATGASADPLIAGCCDSITSQPSYLDLIEDVYLEPNVDDLGVDASPSSSGLSRLNDYLLTEDPDAVIVLSGTPDTFFGPDLGSARGIHRGGYCRKHRGNGPG